MAFRLGLTGIMSNEEITHIKHTHTRTYRKVGIRWAMHSDGDVPAPGHPARLLYRVECGYSLYTDEQRCELAHLDGGLYRRTVSGYRNRG